MHFSIGRQDDKITDRQKVFSGSSHNISITASVFVETSTQTYSFCCILAKCGCFYVAFLWTNKWWWWKCCCCSARRYRRYRRGVRRSRWGRGGNWYGQYSAPTREQLDTEIDDYMSRTRSRLDAEIEAYMGSEMVFVHW